MPSRPLGQASKRRLSRVSQIICSGHPVKSRTDKNKKLEKPKDVWVKTLTRGRLLHFKWPSFFKVNYIYTNGTPPCHCESWAHSRYAIYGIIYYIYTLCKYEYYYTVAIYGRGGMTACYYYYFRPASSRLSTGIGHGSPRECNLILDYCMDIVNMYNILMLMYFGK